MAYGSVNADLMTTSDGVSSSGLYGFKNRLINGACVIDQRNAGASVTPANNDLTLDRWKISISQSSKFTVQQNAGSVTPPSGFTNYLGVTSSSAYSVLSSDYFLISQRIEGFNFADLNWGTANAKTVTVSFWVRSSLTGTFGGSIENSANNRSYPFSYTVSASNTWEYETITIAGDTSGTWIGATNGIGAKLWFSLGAGSAVSTTAGAWAAGDYQSATGATSVVGTNGATFYITGVQLEKGSTATSFDYRSYGTELALCQRYYQKSYEASIVPGTAVAADAKSLINAAWGYAGAVNVIGNGNASFQVSMRAAPTATIYDKAGNSAKMSTQNGTGTYTDNVSANQTIASESNITVQKYAQSCAGIAYAYTVSAEL